MKVPPLWEKLRLDRRADGLPEAARFEESVDHVIESRCRDAGANPGRDPKDGARRQTGYFRRGRAPFFSECGSPLPQTPTRAAGHGS